MSGGGSNTEAESGWSRDEDETFENALVVFREDSPDRWESIAGFLPGKSPADVLAHYEILVADVAAIEAGSVEVPDYPEFPEAGPSRSNRSLCERTKGEPWTIEEHKLFLQGIEMYEWGNWRKIARFLLPGRLPTQVASHAQKFSKRQAEKKKDGMRDSIHDLATVSACEDILEGRLNDATTATATTTTTVVTDASARPSPSFITFDASPFSQGRSNAATATTTATARPSTSLITFDASAFSQGRSNDAATTTATAITDAYARPSPSSITFDDSPFFQGRSNDAATIATTITDAYARPSPSLINSDAYPFSQGRSNDVATTITDACARPSPSMITFDASPFSQGRSNDAAATATDVTDAYARASPSLIIFDASASSQGRGKGSSPFNFK